MTTDTTIDPYSSWLRCTVVWSSSGMQFMRACQQSLGLALLTLCVLLFVIKPHLYLASRRYDYLSAIDEVATLRKMVSCSKRMNSSSCFQIYEDDIIHELVKSSFNCDIDSLRMCFDTVLRDKTDLMVLLRVTECIYSVNSESSASSKSNPNGSQLISYITLLKISGFITGLYLILKGSAVLFNDDEVQSDQKEDGLEALLSKEPLSPDKTLLIKIKQEQFDLSKEEDRQKWKDRFVRVKPADTSTESEGSNLYHTKIGQSLAIEVGNETENRQKQITKARTDINIHNPQEPIPSVLKYPQFDKNGNRLKRIFLPGRGWVSARILEKEKAALVHQMTAITLSKQKDENELDY